MAFIPVPGAAEVVINATCSEIPVANVLGFTEVAGGDFTVAELTTLATKVRDAWQTNMLPVFGGGYELFNVTARSLTSESAPSVQVDVTSTQVGTASGQNMPNNVALVVTHRTALRGRSFRGRTYLVGLTEDQIAGNEVTSGAFTAISAAWAAFYAAVSDSITKLVVISRYSLGVPRSPGIATVVTSSGFRDNKVDTMRRRLS